MEIALADHCQIVAVLQHKLTAPDQPAVPLLLDHRQQDEQATAHDEQRRRVTFHDAGLAAAADLHDGDGHMLAGRQSSQQILHHTLERQPLGQPGKRLCRDQVNWRTAICRQRPALFDGPGLAGDEGDELFFGLKGAHDIAGPAGSGHGLVRALDPESHGISDASTGLSTGFGFRISDC